MTKIKESENSLLGQIWPCYRREMAVIMESWREHMCKELQALPVEEWTYLKFDFKAPKKYVVYRELLRTYKNGWTKFKSIMDMVRFMANGSNIADNEAFETRTETIRQGLKRQKKHIYFKKNHLK